MVRRAVRAALEIPELVKGTVAWRICISITLPESVPEVAGRWRS